MITTTIDPRDTHWPTAAGHTLGARMHLQVGGPLCCPYTIPPKMLIGVIHLEGRDLLQCRTVPGSIGCGRYWYRDGTPASP